MYPLKWDETPQRLQLDTCRRRNDRYPIPTMYNIRTPMLTTKKSHKTALARCSYYEPTFRAMPFFPKNHKMIGYRYSWNYYSFSLDPFLCHYHKRAAPWSRTATRTFSYEKTEKAVEKTDNKPIKSYSFDAFLPHIPRPAQLYTNKRLKIPHTKKKQYRFPEAKKPSKTPSLPSQGMIKPLLCH